MENKPVDIFGNEIAEGNTIAYCIAFGRGQRQAVYKVLAIEGYTIIAEQIHTTSYSLNKRKSRLLDPKNRAVKLWMTFEDGKK